MVALTTCLAGLAAFAGLTDAASFGSRLAIDSTYATVNSSSLLVKTNVGSYMGTVVNSTVRQWLGIRYGAPTNGSLRFRSPQRAAILPADEVFNATSYSPTCPQNRGSAFTGFQLIQDLGNATDGEDCLSLNIWSPMSNSTNSSSTGTAVMIWIYGGAFTFGSSNTPGYQGNNLVKGNPDITVVTINYRTNIFGFPAGSPALTPYAANIGLKDQRMAIEWVYNNIRAFGGDPERIVLFGESAGASSIGAYPYTYSSDPIVKGLIMESGSEYLMASEAIANTTNAQQGWNYIASQVGCPLNSTTTAAAYSQLSCLQSLNFTTIQSAVSNYTAAVADFAPSIDNITVYSAASYTQMASLAEYAKIPVFIGSNNNEGSILIALEPGVPADLITKYGFDCPAASVAASRQNASVPSWQYRYLGMFPGTNPYPALGVYHSSEIGLVFGTYNISKIAPPTQPEIMLSSAMQGGWTAFARDPVHGLSNYGWPLYQANGSTLIQLGGNNSAAIVFNNSQAYNTGCAGIALI